MRIATGKIGAGNSNVGKSHVTVSLGWKLFRPYRMHYCIDVAYCYSCRTWRGPCVCVSVCVQVTRTCCAKAAEPIEMPFGGWLMLVQGKPLLDGVKVPAGRVNFGYCPDNGKASAVSAAVYAAKGSFNRQ